MKPKTTVCGRNRLGVPAVAALVLAAALSLSAAGVHAGWIENGVPLTQQSGAVGPGVIASDGSSGMITAYQACERGVGRIVAQRASSVGTPLWGGNGVVVCAAAGNQENPAIAPDGTGGAIIAWYDGRNAAPGLYAERVNASGVIQWGADGALLCGATGGQMVHAVVSDGSGGAIVAWQDQRSASSYDIYVQRVNASGVVQWAAGGVPLCTAAGDQWQQQITSDGAGGAIVAWYDDRGAYPGAGIYAQRVNASGVVQWEMNGVALCTASGGQWQPRIASDGAGGAIVTWEDYRNGTPGVYTQRVNLTGTVQWEADGVDVCTDTGDEYNPQIASDGAGGAVVAWADWRTGDWNIYAQRVNASGALRWNPEGLSLCTAAGDQWQPQIVSDGGGGAIATWADSRGGAGYDIYAQRANASGVVQWVVGGVALSSAAGNQGYPAVIPDGGGGAIVAWWDERSVNRGIYAQRTNASGVMQWTTDGVPLSAAAGNQEDARIVSDGAGGAIIVWKDSRGGDRDIYAQRVNASGATEWATEGVALCTAVGDQENPEITSDGAGGAIVTWTDSRNGNDNDVYAQRVSASGAIQWEVGGVPISAVSWDQEHARIISDGAGGAVITWDDNRGGDFDYDIYGQRVNASGAAEWDVDGVPVCTAAGDQYGSQIAADGAGGAIVTWLDYRSGSSYDVYAQRVSASGAVQWAADGISLCAASGDQENPCVTSDHAGGAIFAWHDGRTGSDYDIYAQRVNASGTILWGANGVPLCTAADYQYLSDLTSDGAGGAIATWYEYRGGTGSDIYAQRVNSSGASQWTADGVPLCIAAGDQYSPQIVAAGDSGAIVTWFDFRGSASDIYAQRVSGSGTVLWPSDGVPLCTAGAGQYDPRIVTDGAGGAIITWEDERCGRLTYAQRVLASGDLEATLLQQYSAAIEGGAIRVVWVLSEIERDAQFFISRASAPDWNFVELAGASVARDKLSFTFTDAGCVPGSAYQYRVDCEAEGMPRRTLFETERITVPALPLTMYQNHPNPFNPSTVIRFYLPEAQEITLAVYDVRGERVAVLAEGRREKGVHTVTWDGKNDVGAACSSGVYFTRLKAGKSTISRKMVIMR